MRIYVTALAQGTQLAGDFTYTVDDCTASYRVRALYPMVSCATQPDDAGVVHADPTLCDPNAEPDAMRPVGSEFLPNESVTCDPTLLLCVLAGDPPSLR